MALAEWMDKGQPPYDLWEYDVRRVQPFQRNKAYLKERVTETLGLLYDDHFLIVNMQHLAVFAGLLCIINYWRKAL